MNKIKLNKVISDGNIVIPLYILKYYKKMNLTMDEFIFLMYLYNKFDNIDFNPEKIANDLNIDIMEVMGYISVLTDKELLTLEVRKTENNILEEVIDLKKFYDCISNLLIREEDENKKDESVLIYVEHELGRPLNSVEINTINTWIEEKINFSLIKEAIKIALNDGVYSLKYIDKILLDFKTRGIFDVVDINNQKEEIKENDIDMELDDWNWLDDEEEYIIN